MTWIAVEGVVVPIAEGRDGTRRRTVEIGQRRRAIDGSMRSSVFARKKEWEFTSAPIDTGLRDRLLEKLESSSLPLTCIGDAFGESGYADVTFTRSGSVGPFTDQLGVLRSAAANVERTEWFDLDGDGVFETPARLLEAARTNLVDEDDLTNWSTFGSPVVTSGVSDPAGGTGAFTVEDDDGAVRERVQRDVSGFTDGEVNALVFVVRENTPPAGGHMIKLRDTTAPADRLRFEITGWVGGEPTISMTTGTLLGTRPAGDGYWAIYVQTTAITEANTNQIEIAPALTDAETGSIDVYRVGAYADEVPSYSILDASETRNADSFTAPFPHKPSTAQSLYAKWVEVGGAFQAGGFTRPVMIGGSSEARFGIQRDNSSGDGRYEAHLSVDGSQVATAEPTGTVSMFDEVEFVATAEYDTDAGEWTLAGYLSIEGGAVTSDSSTAAGDLPGAWQDDEILLASNAGEFALQSVKVQSGTKSLARMRTLPAPDLFPGITAASLDCYAEIGDVRPVTIEGRRGWVVEFTLFEG